MSHLPDNVARRLTVLSELIPILKENVIGTDFRPGKGGRIISTGIRVKVTTVADPLIECQCGFDEETPAREAHVALLAEGYLATIKAPHIEVIECDGEASNIRDGLWRVYWKIVCTSGGGE